MSYRSSSWWGMLRSLTRDFVPRNQKKLMEMETNHLKDDGPCFFVCERWWWDVKRLMVQKSDTDQLIKNIPHKFDRVCYTCTFLYIHSVYLHIYIYTLHLYTCISQIFLGICSKKSLVKRDRLSISFATATFCEGSSMYSVFCMVKIDGLFHPCCVFFRFEISQKNWLLDLVVY